MTTDSTVKLTISLIDPELDAEELDEETQQLWIELYLARSWIEIFAPKIPQCWGTLKPINRERFPQNLVG